MAVVARWGAVVAPAAGVVALPVGAVVSWSSAWGIAPLAEVATRLAVAGALGVKTGGGVAAVGGLALAFGAPYILTAYGVL